MPRMFEQEKCLLDFGLTKKDVLPCLTNNRYDTNMWHEILKR